MGCVEMGLFIARCGVAGIRPYEMATRLRYAKWPHSIFLLVFVSAHCHKVATIASRGTGVSYFQYSIEMVFQRMRNSFHDITR
jgi:hypothetical protein